jgi:hypothetical protein
MDTYYLVPESEYLRRCRNEAPDLDKMIKETLTRPFPGPEDKADAINDAVDRFRNSKRQREDSLDRNGNKKLRLNPVSRKRSHSPDDQPSKRARPDQALRKRSHSPDERNEPNKQLTPRPDKRIRPSLFPLRRRKRSLSLDKTDPKGKRPRKQPIYERRKRSLENKVVTNPKRLKAGSVECSPEPQNGGWLSLK